MTKSSENRKINAKTREWDADKAWLNNNWHKFWKSIKNIIKSEKNKMMYGKKETNRIVMTSTTIAKKYAKPDCKICEGTGVTLEPESDDEDYCLCVINNEEYLNSDE